MKTMTNDEARSCPPALFVRPLYRLRLDSPDDTSLGYTLIDVIAILPPRPLREQGSRFPFPHLVCLGLDADGLWREVSIADGDGHCDLSEAYMVVQ